MKRFRFPLDGLQRVREQQVREREIALARKVKEHRETGRMRDGQMERLEVSVRKAPRGQVVDVTELLESERERHRLRRDLRDTEEKLAGWALQIEEERVHLLTAHREAEAVARLRERRYLEFVREVLRADQKQTDEVASRGERIREAA